MNLPKCSAPLLLAVEGLCGAGKTTLATALARHLTGARVLREYADLAPLPPFPASGPADIARSLRHFLTLEQLRQDTARGGSAAIWLADRSPLTLIAFEYAAPALGAPGDPEHAIALFADAAEQDIIAAPDAYISLRIPPATARQRVLRRGPVRADLLDPHAIARQTAVIDDYLRQVPSHRRLLLDATQPPPTLLARACAFATATSTRMEPGPPSWRTLLRAGAHPASTYTAP